ncbi:cytochrome c oxidase assembly protein [Frondihabitans cladoniiphilus]|uniref:Cytochrome c oxidase assembly protein n=1 Tax=Frondihabitans cladoniiphilus TaxID=715785 RepID=A0ABP8WBJ3_9MICO
MPRLTRIAGPALLALVAFAALLVALVYGGASAKPLLEDPGAVVRYGLPIASLFTDLGAALTIGTLALGTFALTPSRPEWARALDIASAGAAFWTVASAVTGFFTFLSVSNVRVTADAKFGESLAFFLTNTSLGLAWLISTLVAALVTVLCFAVRGVTPVFLVALVAGAALIPIAGQGHAAGTTGHVAAVTALGLHIEGAAVWLGGLLALVLLRPVLDRPRVGLVLARYSTLALLCFVVVAVSGVASAGIRLGSWSELGSRYGVLVVVKIVALVVLGLFGVVHRQVLVGRMQNSPAARQGTFWWFVSAELAFLGIASGVAAALARTADPVSAKALTDTGAVSPAEVLTDSPLPLEFSPLRWVSGWNLDLVWLLACAFLVAFYVAGVVRVRRRGEAWPMGRTIRWCLGLVVLFLATNGALNVYERYLISAHFVLVGLVAFVVPALLASGAPWTLALVSIAKRTDGSRGPREWLMLVVRSRGAAVLTHPVSGVVLLAASLWAWLFTPLFRWSLTTYGGHTVLVLQLVLVGWLVVQALLGLDPVRYATRTGIRLAVVGGTVVVAAVVGIVPALGDGLLLANWYGAMGRLWGAPPVADQHEGGVALALIGVVVAAVLAVVVAVRAGRRSEG